MAQTNNRYQMNENKKRRLSAVILELVQNTVSPVSEGFRRRMCLRVMELSCAWPTSTWSFSKDLAREIVKPGT